MGTGIWQPPRYKVRPTWSEYRAFPRGSILFMRDGRAGRLAGTFQSKNGGESLKRAGHQWRLAVTWFTGHWWWLTALHGGQISRSSHRDTTQVDVKDQRRNASPSLPSRSGIPIRYVSPVHLSSMCCQQSTTYLFVSHDSYTHHTACTQGPLYNCSCSIPFVKTTVQRAWDIC